MTNTLTESVPGKSSEIAPGPLQGTTQNLAKVLREHRHELATLLMGNVADWEKFASLIPEDPESLREHVELEHYTFVNLLALLFESGDDSFKDIYIGHKILQLYWPGFQSPSEREALVAKVLEADEHVLRDFLEGKVGADDLARLKGARRDQPGPDGSRQEDAGSPPGRRLRVRRRLLVPDRAMPRRRDLDQPDLRDLQEPGRSARSFGDWPTASSTWSSTARSHSSSPSSSPRPA